MVSTVVPFANSNQELKSTSKWNIFKLQRLILLGFGCWPPDRVGRPWYMKALVVFHLATLAICIVGESLYGLHAYQNGRLSEAIESICPTVARLSGFLRICFILINEQKFENILNNISNIIQNGCTDPVSVLVILKLYCNREKPYNYENSRENSGTIRLMSLGQQLTKWMLCASLGTGLFYGIIPYIIMTYNLIQGQKPLVKLLPFKVLLPYDSQDPFLYTITNIFLNYASFPTITAMNSDITLFCRICLYIYGQFQAIQLEIEDLSATLDKISLKSSSSETRRIDKELRRISKRHQDIIDLVAEVRSAYMPNILTVYICASIMLCIVSTAVFIVDGIYLLTYVPYTISIIMMLFLYSYSGTIICDSNELVETAAYDFPWYRFDRNIHHLIQMMMIRAQRGCNVDVPFFNTSLATFSVILRTAMSYVTLMKSFL